MKTSPNDVYEEGKGFVYWGLEEEPNVFRPVLRGDIRVYLGYLHLF